jgi:hypothetical protein
MRAPTFPLKNFFFRPTVKALTVGTKKMGLSGHDLIRSEHLFGPQNSSLDGKMLMGVTGLVPLGRVSQSPAKAVYFLEEEENLSMAQHRGPARKTGWTRVEIELEAGNCPRRRVRVVASTRSRGAAINILSKRIQRKRTTRLQHGCRAETGHLLGPPALRERTLRGRGEGSKYLLKDDI